jgi:hypothetical protein
MRFEVPQFIEIEDKIFGPFTWRQFLYLSGGLGMSIAIFITLPLVVFILIGLPLALLAGALSFYPVNNRPFSFFLEAVISYITSQRLYLWRQKTTMVHKKSFLPKMNSYQANTNKTSPAKTGQKKSVASLARKLELQALQKTE